MALDPKAVKAANEALWKAHPELKGRQLTMEPKDAALRAEWGSRYSSANHKTTPPLPQAQAPSTSGPTVDLTASAANAWGSAAKAISSVYIPCSWSAVVDFVGRSWKRLTEWDNSPTKSSGGTTAETQSTRKSAPSPKTVRDAIPKSEYADLGWEQHKYDYLDTDSNSKNNKDPVGLGYCTDYAKLIYSKVTGIQLTNMPDAQDWLGAVPAEKVVKFDPNNPGVIKDIPPGSIAVWKGGDYGHVAVVVENDPVQGRMEITEANWARIDGGDPIKQSQDPYYNYRSEEAVTDEFDRHTESTKSYQNIETRGTYQLLGFILP